MLSYRCFRYNQPIASLASVKKDLLAISNEQSEIDGLKIGSSALRWSLISGLVEPRIVYTYQKDDQVAALNEPVLLRANEQRIF